MPKPAVYLFAPASPGQAVLDAYHLASARELICLADSAVGNRYRVCGKPAIIDAKLDEARGGRSDDIARVREIEQVLADDDIVALVAVRGGAWLTRILPQIDFTRLAKRKKPLSIFGFSEITPLINIIGSHAKGYGYYYMTPGFPRLGMARYARVNIKKTAPGKRLTGKRLERFAEGWAEERAAEQFRAYFEEIVGIIEGRTPERPFTGKLVFGNLPRESDAVFSGGCLSLVTPMTTTKFARKHAPRNKWLALEDLEEYPYRLDRQFAHLKLAGWFDVCAGLLIGDFHIGDEDQTAEVLAMLKYHLPKDRKVPIIVSKDMGHIWPQSPLPLGRKVKILCSRAGRGRPTVRLQLPWTR